MVCTWRCCREEGASSWHPMVPGMIGSQTESVELHSSKPCQSAEKKTRFPPGCVDLGPFHRHSLQATQPQAVDGPKMTTKISFPNGGCYRGAPLYIDTCTDYIAIQSYKLQVVLVMW